MTPLEILGLPEGSDVAAIQVRWRELRSSLHPDHGGDAEAFYNAGKAYDEALAEASQPKPCQSCGGSGKIGVARGFNQINVICPSCDGSGERS